MVFSRATISAPETSACSRCSAAAAARSASCASSRVARLTQSASRLRVCSSSPSPASMVRWATKPSAAFRSSAALCWPSCSASLTPFSADRNAASAVSMWSAPSRASSVAAVTLHRDLWLSLHSTTEASGRSSASTASPTMMKSGRSGRPPPPPPPPPVGRSSLLLATAQRRLASVCARCALRSLCFVTTVSSCSLSPDASARHLARISCAVPRIAAACSTAPARAWLRMASCTCISSS
mmetsp:Transcript_2474/g.8809  ORF Transcript_2474/g.8809 Transcript_2474/m.8809 type:complete len:239 (+) Transcript_2474:4003-4719(+)